MKDYFNLRREKTAALRAPRNVSGGSKPGVDTFIGITNTK